MSKRFIVMVACGVIGLALLVNGCAGTKVKRVEVEEQIDLSGNWNDTDSRLVSEEMIKDCLARPWKDVFTATKGKQPKVIVGTVKNRSQEHIAVETFVKDLERSLINSGQVGFVASKNERNEIREEKVDQAEYARQETAKQSKQETGADFMLQGQLNTIVDMSGKQAVKYYQVELELVNILTNEKVWIGQKKIKKLVTRPQFKP
ncbi:MAG: penicillin-binding protein activator LpoB [bacterium]